MRNKATSLAILACILLELPVANAAVIQTNYNSTLGTGGGTFTSVNTPGGAFDAAGNLLSSNLVLATFLSGGSFYKQDSGYPVVLSRLYDGSLGTIGSTGLGSDGNYTVMPNLATIQFDLDGAFDLTGIRTYASWGTGRDGQRYVVKYATANDPTNFINLYTVSQYNPTGGTVSSTLVTLRENSTGVLAENVVSLQFVFDGYENGGTAFREFQVLGTPVSSVPETGNFLPAVMLVAGALLRCRPPRSIRSGG
jgi:hypothetical protein